MVLSGQEPVAEVPILRLAVNAAGKAAWLGLALGCLCATALAQQAPAPDATSEPTALPRAWRIVPRVMLQETYTDNATLSVSGVRSDWITEIAPGVRIQGRTKRLQLDVDYGLHQLYYANGSRGDQTQQTLNSTAKLEAIEKFLFVDMAATVMQQNISAFGTQSASNYSVNSNSTETQNFKVSPYIKGKLGGYADYEGRYTKNEMHTKSAAVPDSSNETWSGKLSGDTLHSVLGWSVDADNQKTDYHGGRGYESEHWRGQLNYRVIPELTLSVSSGQERNDYATSDMTGYSTRGFGFDWRPSDRTDVSAFREKRFFGDGHTVTLSNRWSRSTIKFTDSRDVMVLPNQSGTVYATYREMLFALNQNEFPDSASLNAALDSFFANHPTLNPNMLTQASLLTGIASVERRQELSYALVGVRNSLTLAWRRTHDDRLGTLFLADVDLSSTSSVNQQGVNVNWSHQLSALSSFNLSADRSRNTSGTDANMHTDQKALSATVTSKLGARTRGSLSARKTVFSGTAGAYSENALAGAVTVEF